MKPKITINAATYGILCFAGAGSFILPSDMAMPTALATTAVHSDTAGDLGTISDLPTTNTDFQTTSTSGHGLILPGAEPVTPFTVTDR